MIQAYPPDCVIEAAHEVHINGKDSLWFFIGRAVKCLPYIMVICSRKKVIAHYSSGPVAIRNEAMPAVCCYRQRLAILWDLETKQPAEIYLGQCGCCQRIYWATNDRCLMPNMMGE